LLRGEGYEDSYLLRSKDGKQCCIGFLCEAFGVPKPDLKDIRGSQKLVKYRNLPEWLTVDSATDVSIGSDLFIAYALNDNKRLSEADREQRIAEIFAKHDIQVEFVG
jgi:hypothetical protein